jgi:hypothetical protein
MGEFRIGRQLSDELVACIQSSVFSTNKRWAIEIGMKLPCCLVADTLCFDMPVFNQILVTRTMVIEPWTRARTLHHVYLTPRIPYTTCTLHHVYTSSLHLSMVVSHGITPEPTEPRHCILDFGQVILHMATLHHTTFSPHISSITTSVFGCTT